MTLNKSGARAYLDKFFLDYGDNHRFELEDNGKFVLTPQAAKDRVLHDKQIRFVGACV